MAPDDSTGASEPPSLHETGWRQGSVFSADLPASSLALVEGQVQEVHTHHPLWVMASQDCDIDAVPVTATEPGIEIRPVFSGDPGTGWGIRSRCLRLSDDSYLAASAPRVLIAPAILANLVGARREPLPSSRVKALKTWLGLRYDRPAVPQKVLALAREIAAAAKRTRTAMLTDTCHDVLMQFSPGRPPRFALVAVVVDGANEDAVAEWMAQLALEVPAHLGVMSTAPSIVTKASLSLSVVEDSYSADLSDITWRRPGPQGAT